MTLLTQTSRRENSGNIQLLKSQSVDLHMPQTLLAPWMCLGKDVMVSPDTQELHITGIPVAELQLLGASCYCLLLLATHRHQIYQLAPVRHLELPLCCRHSTTQAHQTLSPLFSEWNSLPSWSPKSSNLVDITALHETAGNDTHAHFIAAAFH